MRKALQIQSFYELPKEKIPPENIWFDEEELSIWFENLSEGNSTSTFINENDIE